MRASPESRSPQSQSFRLLPSAVTAFADRVYASSTAFFANSRVHPNLVTITGLLSGLGAGLLFAFERPAWAGALVVFCGVLDILDGLVASATKRSSLFGAVLDSSLDRYAEFFIYAGLAFHFRNGWAVVLPPLAFLGGFMVSYTRARAEGLGFECRTGIMQRAERIILLSLAALLGPLFRIFDPAMIVALIMITLFSHIAAGQKICLVRTLERAAPDQKTRQKNPHQER